MQVVLYIIIIVGIAYGGFVGFAIIGLFTLRTQKNNTATITTSNFVSVIISARNEEETIEKCIRQLILQRFDKEQFELIIIDDASEDNTYELAESILKDSDVDYRLIKQPAHQGKKKNLAIAIELAKGDIIITSDADITYRSLNWLSYIASYFEAHNPNLLILPIDFKDEYTFISKFQIVENIALMAVSAGYTTLKKSFMCSGANLAFKKSAYVAVKGYQSHIHIASGDDVFLLEDIKKLDVSAIHYLSVKDVIVTTKSQPDFKSLLNQRVRWASKFRHNTNWLNFFGGLVVLLANLFPLALLVSVLNQSVILVPYLVTFTLVKVIFDFLLLFLASHFLNKAKYFWWLLSFECVYFMYALIVGIASLFYKPYWKHKKIT